MRVSKDQPELYVEKVYGDKKTETLFYMKNSFGFVGQVLVTAKELERLHNWIGQRLSEVL